MDEYDVIIVGASFGGLAVASRLKGRVLLLDRKGIGEDQTSACATTLSLVLRLAGPDAVLQTHQTAYLHLGAFSLLYRLPIPLCTFDYRQFCQSLFCKGSARFLQAVVHGIDRGTVATDRGDFCGRYVVDASGWRAVLATSADSAFRQHQRLAFALETEVPSGGNGLQFYLDDATKTGYGWRFPCGNFGRVGWGCYTGTTGLKNRLERLTDSQDEEVGQLHGGFLSYRLQDPVQGDVFLVGDAAGQCLPFTGEGIRPAVYFGHLCGDIIQSVLDGQLSREQGMEEYRRVVSHYRLYYRRLEGLQRLMKWAPLSGIMALGRLSTVSPLGSRTIARYLHAFQTRAVIPEAVVNGVQ